MTTDLERWQSFLQKMTIWARPSPAPTSRTPTPTRPRACATSPCRWCAGSGGRSATATRTLPTFQRQNDLVRQWGGPNADNVYRHARVDASLRYRIVGKMHCCSDFILAIRAQLHAHGGSGTTSPSSPPTTSASVPATTSRSCSAVKATSPTGCRCPRARCRCRSASTTSTGSREEPATFTIERLDADEPPGRSLRRRWPRGSTRPRRTRTARSRTGTSTCSTARAKQADNEFGGRHDVPRGLQVAKYAFCFFDLAPDEALIVESDIPESRYWSWHLYNLAWWEALEYASRVTTLNHTQARVERRRQAAVRRGPPGPGRAQLARHRSPPPRGCSPSGGSGRPATRPRPRPAS